PDSPTVTGAELSGLREYSKPVETTANISRAIATQPSLEFCLAAITALPPAYNPDPTTPTICAQLAASDNDMIHAPDVHHDRRKKKEVIDIMAGELLPRSGVLDHAEGTVVCYLTKLCGWTLKELSASKRIRRIRSRRSPRGIGSR